MRWLLRLIGRDRFERDLDRELLCHVALEAERLEDAGVPPAEARRRALAALGGLEPTKEHARDVRGTRWIEDLLRDLRYGGRMMRRGPLFAATAVLSLAIGIGANAALFNVINALLLRTLPIARPAEIYLLNHAGFDEPNLRFSVPALEALRTSAPEASFAAMTPLTRFQVTAGGGAEFALGQLVTGNWFDVAGVGADTGRLFGPADDVTVDGHPVLVLSDAYWARRFGRDPGVIGRTLTMNGVPFTIIGVAEAGFFGFTVGQSPDLWAPASMQHALRYAGNARMDGDITPDAPWRGQRYIHWLHVVARVDARRFPAATEAAAAGHRRELEEQLAPVTDPQAREYRLRERLEWLSGAQGLSDVRDNFSRPLGVLMATVALVLLVACANLASLLLARSASRQREFSLRLSLGAARWRLVRQLLTESLLLSGLGGLLGLSIAVWGSRALLSLAATGAAAIPLDVAPDWRLLAFTGGVSMATGLAFGLVPALRFSRAGLGDGLRGAGRVVGRPGGRGPLPIGRLLIVAQVALALVLLTGAVLFMRTLANLVRADAGFDRERVVTARIDPRSSGIGIEALPALYASILDHARGIPGVGSASLALSGPVTGSQSVSGIEAAGRERVLGVADDAREDFVSQDFLNTVGIPMLRGRPFAATDVAGAPLVAIVNETFARHFFGNEDPIGKRFGYDSAYDRVVIGVVRDAHIDGIRSDVPRLAYYPLAQHPRMFARNVYVRTSGGGVGQIKSALERAVAAAHADLAIREVVTLGELSARTVARERLVSQLTAAFAGLALGVACLGLFGTLSYSVARRTNEIGVRLALGASRTGVLWLVLGEVLALLGAGTAAGLVLAVAALRSVDSLLYGLTATDPASLASAVAALVGVGLAASLWPAWRAARVSPAAALRND